MSCWTGTPSWCPQLRLLAERSGKNPVTWPAYRQLVRTVVAGLAHFPVVLLGVCTPAELRDWPIDTWVLLDCADRERQRRLGEQAQPDRVREAVRDGREYRSLGLSLIDTTGRLPAAVAPARGLAARTECVPFTGSLHEAVPGG